MVNLKFYSEYWYGYKSSISWSFYNRQHGSDSINITIGMLSISLIFQCPIFCGCKEHIRRIIL